MIVVLLTWVQDQVIYGRMVSLCFQMKLITFAILDLFLACSFLNYSYNHTCWSSFKYILNQDLFFGIIYLNGVVEINFN